LPGLRLRPPQPGMWNTGMVKAVESFPAPPSQSCGCSYIGLAPAATLVAPLFSAIGVQRLLQQRRPRRRGRGTEQQPAARVGADHSHAQIAPMDAGHGVTAVQVVQRLWGQGLPRSDEERARTWLSSFSPEAVVEDTYRAEAGKGLEGARAYLENKTACGRLVIERLSDGEQSCGFTWHLEEDGVDGIGLRGTTFVAVDTNGQVAYLREIAEPLFKPGDQTVQFLKAVGGDNVATFDLGELPRRKPSGASDLCQYLWAELQGRAPPDEALELFADDVLYEDFNYESPMRGKAEVGDFIRKFADIRSLKFVSERFSDGAQSCCFTWHVEIAGLSNDAGSTRGISFYGLSADGLVNYVRDIPESVMKPPPLQALAAMVRPQLRVFQPLPVP